MSIEDNIRCPVAQDLVDTLLEDVIATVATGNSDVNVDEKKEDLSVSAVEESNSLVDDILQEVITATHKTVINGIEDSGIIPKSIGTAIHEAEDEDLLTRNFAMDTQTEIEEEGEVENGEMFDIVLDQKNDNISSKEDVEESEQPSQSLEEQIDMISDIVREVQEAEEALALEGDQADGKNCRTMEIDNIESKTSNNLVDIQITPLKSDSNAEENPTEVEPLEIIENNGDLEETVSIEEDIVLIAKSGTEVGKLESPGNDKTTINVNAVDDCKANADNDESMSKQANLDEINFKMQDDGEVNIVADPVDGENVATVVAEPISIEENTATTVSSNDEQTKREKIWYYGKYYKKFAPSIGKVLNESVKPKVHSLSSAINHRYKTAKDGTYSTLDEFTTYVDEKKTTTYCFVNEKSDKAMEWVGTTTKNLSSKSMKNAKTSIASAKQLTSKTIGSAKEMTSTTINNVKNVTTASIGFGINRYQESRQYIGNILTKVRRKKQLQELGTNEEDMISEEEEEYNRLLQYEKAAEVTIKAGNSERLLFHLEEGQTLTWDFQLKNKDLDIKFGAYERVQDFGGSKEVLIFEECDKIQGAELISGQYMAERPMTIVLVWDNSYSRIRSKTVASCVRILKVPSAPYMNINPMYANTISKTEIKTSLEPLGEDLEEEAKEES